jgi:hypothetical protein
MADQEGGRELAKRPSRRLRLRMEAAEGGEGKLSVCRQFTVFIIFIWYVVGKRDWQAALPAWASASAHAMPVLRCSIPPADAHTTRAGW